MLKLTFYPLQFHKMSNIYVKDMAGSMLCVEILNNTLVSDVKEKIYKWMDEYEIYRQSLSILTDTGYIELYDTKTCVSYGIKPDDMIYLYVNDPLWRRFMDDFISGFYTVTTIEKKYGGYLPCFQKKNEEKCEPLWEQIYKDCEKFPDEPISQCLLGACYFYPRGGVEQNYELATMWFQKSVEGGNLQAVFMLSYCYEMGFSVEQNDSNALQLLQNAAERGHVQAQNRLAICYGKGHLGVPKDEKRAIIWYEKAAEQNYPAAQYNLGIKLYQGIGLEKDETKSVYWYQRASEKGSVEAQFNLGVCYDKGEGVVSDIQTAVKWYEKSALQDNMYAQHNLGICYINGRGVTKDIMVGVDWLRKSANNGHRESRVILEELPL